MRQSGSTSDELIAEYNAWTSEALAAMQAHLKALLAGTTDRSECLNEIFGIAHNIKGMGATFGFPLMTELGTSLCDYLRHGAHDPAQVSNRVVTDHVQSIQRVFDDKVEGDGGDEGRALMQRLAAIIEAEG